MEKTNRDSFDSDYSGRTHIAVLMKQIVSLEIALAFVAFLLNFLVFSGGSLIVETSNTFYMGSFFLMMNIIIFIFLFLRWYNKYYVISRDRIYSSAGIIFRKTQSIDMIAVRSVSVHQNFFGKIFNYGTLILESPLLKEKFFIHDMPSPFKHASLIEESRMKMVHEGGSENVIISATS